MVYRVQVYDENMVQHRNEYFGSMAAAKRRITEMVRTEGYVRRTEGNSCFRIDSVPTPKTKKGWVELLDDWGGNPTSGEP